MTKKLLQMIIATAGPRLAGALAQAILGYLAKLTKKTDTQIDDDILEIIMRALEANEEDHDRLEP